MRSSWIPTLAMVLALNGCGGTNAPPVEAGCGDGTVDAAGGEQCDDGNLDDRDGCDKTCRLEAFDVCEGITASPSNGLVLKQVANGLESPVSGASAPRDLRRLYILEQAGRIRILKDGVLQEEPFLDLRREVLGGGERGLLGLAFAPDFVTSRRFYVYYTRRSDTAQVLARYKALSADRADPESAEVLLAMDDPAGNHNGGQIAFGVKDGLLYAGTGDGGGAGDRFNQAQNRGTLLGKLLRLDVSGASGYQIPPTNPFLTTAGNRGEIWAFGLRNPWRFSFDRANGDLYIGDVGQNAFEEVDYQPGTSAGGENYGWPIVEGLGHCFRPAADCDQTGLVQPVIDIPQTGGACSVISGFVYRGCGLNSAVRGTYFYSDYCLSFFRTVRMQGGVATEPADRTGELIEQTGAVRLVTSFVEDARGEIYVLSHEGGVYQIVSR